MKNEWNDKFFPGYSLVTHPYGNFLLILQDPVQTLLPIEPIPICVPIAFYTNPHEDTCPITVIHVSDCPHWTGAS